MIKKTEDLTGANIKIKKILECVLILISFTLWQDVDVNMKHMDAARMAAHLPEGQSRRDVGVRHQSLAAVRMASLLLLGSSLTGAVLRCPSSREVRIGSGLSWCRGRTLYYFSITCSNIWVWSTLDYYMASFCGFCKNFLWISLLFETAYACAYEIYSQYQMK